MIVVVGLVMLLVGTCLPCFAMDLLTEDQMAQAVGSGEVWVYDAYCTWVSCSTVLGEGKACGPTYGCTRINDALCRQRLQAGLPPSFSTGCEGWPDPICVYDIEPPVKCGKQKDGTPIDGACYDEGMPLCVNEIPWCWMTNCFTIAG